jgi:hypothetical protein
MSTRNFGRFTSCFAVIILICNIHVRGAAQGLTPLVQSASNFLKTLNPDQLKATQYQFNDSLRYKWSNLPVGFVS